MSLASRSPHSLLLLAALHAPLLTACGPDKDPLDGLTTAMSGSPTGSPSGGSDPSGDPSGGSNTSGNSTDDPTGGGTGSSSVGTTTVGTSGVTTTETGGGDGHPSCDQFLLCLGAINPEGLPEAEMTFGPGGTCWQGTPEQMQTCIEQCETGLGTFGELYPDEPACGGSGSTTTDGTTTNTTDATTDPSETSGGGGYGLCGWNATEKYYACDSFGGVPGVSDPDDISPIDCPQPLPEPGAMCDETSPVNGVGCCLPNGDNYYCAGGEITVDNCGA